MAGRPKDHLFIIVGGTGDLARRKLLPALYASSREQRDWGLKVLCTGRRAMEQEEFLEQVGENLQDPEALNWLSRKVSYFSLKGHGFAGLRHLVEEWEREGRVSGNRVIYCALPPSVLDKTVEELGGAGLAKGPGWVRLVIEKPFGHDLHSAKELNRLIHTWFDEDQVYRIDHYLGKETVQNLLFFRFANTIFESIWNRDWIDHVQITVAEEIGVGTRAGYYDTVGAVRDMIQNHLTQLLVLTAMEMPASFDADSIRYEKVKALKSILPIGPDDVVLGQYGPGSVAGVPVPGYRDEPGIPHSSTCETFAAIKINMANLRWQGVPFYLRTGKRLKKRITKIEVVFKCIPAALFQPFDSCRLESNRLSIHLQPNEGFDLLFEVKRPGQPVSLDQRTLSFRYRDAFGELPDPYSTLINDIVNGDQTLFVRSDEVEWAWKIYDPVIEADLPVHLHPAGSWGPDAADELLSREGRRWFNP